jgi:hypothetical protein
LSFVPDTLFSTCSTLFSKLLILFLFGILTCLFWTDYFLEFYWFPLSYPG